MSTMIAGQRPASQSGELARGEALFELELLTGVKTELWLGAPDESVNLRAERLEFLADVMLGIDEGEVTKAGEKAKAARVAELHRVVLGELVDAPALLFRHAHGDPADWSEADFEAYDNIARADELHTELELRVFIGKARVGRGAASAAAVRELVAEVRAA
ncbi:hypothetical protein QCN29_32430 [Streptomyces sp. HNM0663]|uniref:Uncharacterized protein n=1 Tax=Streptomyces chengmaiensis TaxID=3040919 RepID=A0ABT6HYG8_9ACTN|nr:hypothetical protein [Streptomyces chengmaiensis]MDH2393391.1 hypothetical protein [Streptomyces chengmaiensis]